MIASREGLRDNARLRDRCHLVLEIHDELMFEVRLAAVTEAATLIRECMEQAWKGLRVPLAVRMKVGESWGQAEDYNI